MSEWINYQNIDFSGEFAWINIDTRDFHAIQITDKAHLDLEMPPNYRNNKEKYFHTPEEVKALIDRYFEESGGKGTWRMFGLEHAPDITGWDMKYIAVVAHDLGLLVCTRVHNSKTRPLKKSVLAAPVKKRQLNHMAD